MELFNKIKNKLGFLALFALLFQLMMPVYQTYVFATENAPIEVEAGADEDMKDDEITVPEIEGEKDEVEVEPEEKDVETSEEDILEQETVPEEVEETSLGMEAVSLELLADTEGNQGTEITDNIIDLNSIKLLYEDETEVGSDDIVDPNENLSFHLTWTLLGNHGYKDGAYFKFKLPKQLKIYNEIQKPMGEYASVFVDTNGEVTFTFNEKIEVPDTNVTGTFGVKTELIAIEDESMEETLKVIIGKEVIKEIKINVKPTGGKIIEKNGETVGKKFNAKEIQWTVDINTKRDSLKDVVIEDTLSKGQEWILNDDENIVYKLHEIEVNNKGEFVKELDLVESSPIKPEHLKIKLGDTNKAYRLTFKTQFTEGEQGAEGTKKYSNKVSLTSTDTGKVNDSADVFVKRPESLQKEASEFQTGNRSVKWTVKANFTEQSLAAGDEIVDEFTFKVGEQVLDDIFEIEHIKIKQVDEFNDEGDVIDSSDATNMFDDPIIVNNKVTYRLKEATDKAFVITYETVAKPGKIINDDGKITNEVTLTGQTDPVKQTVNIQQQVLKKSHSEINYADKTIDWTITVNADEQVLKNFVLTDRFENPGQKLVEDSIKGVPSGAQLAKDTDLQGFQIDFGTITDTYTINYTTKFTYDFSHVKEGERPNFKNKAKVSYEVGDQNNEYTQIISKEPAPNPITKKNGAKSGKADNDSKIITWTVDVNYNHLKLENAKLIDTIEANQSLDYDSVKIYKTNIDPAGKITIVRKPLDEGQITVNKKGVTVNEETRDQIEVNFGVEIKESYRLVFKTKDRDGIYNKSDTGKAYNNTAKFSSKGKDTQKLDASAEFDDQGKFLSKDGNQNFTDWTIDWEIIVNESLSNLNNVEVRDTLGDGQILLNDTIRVTNIQTDKLLVEDTDYKLVLDGNELLIKFVDGDGKAYKITDDYKVTYSSYITEEEHNKNLKNTAKITSETPVKGDIGKNESVQIKTSSGYGTSQGEVNTGNLTIKKTEKDSNRPLSGVEFELIKRFDGGQEIIVRDGKTDSNGNLEWKNIAYGKYTLEESIPTGYEGEGEVRKQEVEIAAINTEGAEYVDGLQTLPIENTRKTGQFKIIKLDANTGEALKGTKFKIKNQTTKQEYTFTTNSKGEILEVVPYGKYTVVEVTAPAGYRITEDIENITVDVDQTATLENTLTVENVAYIDISVQKTWYVDKQSPEPITVKLLANGEEIKEQTITSENDWKYTFKDLDKYDADNKKITYTIKEVSIDGYIVEETEVAKEDRTKEHIHEFNLTNIESTSISGEKIWKDDDDATGKRPASITVDLTGTIEKEDELQTEVVITKSTTASASTKWEYEFADLPKYTVNGEKITYAVKETVDGYDTDIEETDKGFDITNTRANDLEINGEKIWKDANPGSRPAEIEVELYRQLKDEEAEVIKTEKVTPDEEGKWFYDFETHPQFNEEGVEYTYSVKEKEVPSGYRSSVQGYDITNLRVGSTSLSGTKHWKDDTADARPDSITVNLLRNGQILQSKKVTADDNWTYTFTNLSMYDSNGKYYSYRISEDKVPGYVSTIQENDIINTRSETTAIEITKSWLDDNATDRPTSIDVDVYRNDELFDTVTLSAADAWSYELTDLEGFDEDGQAYTYTIEEETVDGYEASVEDFDITNLRVGMTEVNVLKNWVNDEKENRPETIEVDLLRNGKVVETILLSETTGWKYTFTDLPEFDQEGKAYEYSVQEKPVKGYRVRLEETDAGFEITNTYLRPGDVEGAEKPGDPGEGDKEPKPTTPGKGEVIGAERPVDGVGGYYAPDGTWLPKTGETSNIGLYLVGGLLILGGLFIGKRRIEE